MMVAIPALARAATVRALLATLALFPLAGCRSSLPPGYAEWREGRPSSIAHREAAVLELDGKLFVFGGFYTGGVKTTDMVEIYDPVANSWSRRASMPAPAPTHLTAVRDGEDIWFAGGFAGDHPGPTTDRVLRYNMPTDSWATGPSLPAPRGSGLSVLLGRNLHFISGYMPDRITGSADHWILSVDGAMAWRNGAPLPNPRGHASGVEIGGMLYVVGGALPHDTLSYDIAAVNVYDPVANTWTRAADTPRPLSHAETSTFALDGQIIVVGGRDIQNQEGRPKEGVRTILAYDPVRNVWVDVDDLPEPRHGAAARVIGDQLVVHGGSADWREPVATTVLIRFRDAWRPRKPMPVALGDVAAGVLGGSLIVVGEGSPATLIYDLDSARWENPDRASKRPFPGHHHAAESWNGKLYLFGGFGAEGKTQIYDPRTDRWEMGAPVPFAAGSSASAVIGDTICVAGGIIGERTTNQAACYDPVRNSWTAAAPMKQPRNHTAAASDGKRMYVFGGRGPGNGDANVVANGFADVQIYDPASDTWLSSSDVGSGIARLPQARGGMGKAVYLQGEFYVFGGETLDGPGATEDNVYARVDIYDPRRNAWRAGTPMPVARHGVFPVAVAGRIFVAGGGVKAANSQSQTFDVYTPPAPRSESQVSARATRTP